MRMTRSSAVLCVLVAILRPCLATDLTTLPIPTFRLDLTIKRRTRVRDLLRGGDGRGDEHRGLQRSVDGTIRSLAERHLAAIYGDAFAGVPPPSQVLLTLSTPVADDDDGGGGIYVRSSFAGGVVGFPVPRDGAPGRSELGRVTLEAFQIPGAGEAFLEALEDASSDHPALEGLLLIAATEVQANYDDDGKGYEDEKGDQTDSPGEGADDLPMNIWAVAAVAALAAMFLVIVLCTSILYCDWRKRKLRRDARQDRAAAAQANRNMNGATNSNNYRGGGSKKGSANSHRSSTRSADQGFVEPPKIQLRSEALQVVVRASSGDTEAIGTSSPSTQGSNEKEGGHANNDANNNSNNNNNNNNNNTKNGKNNITSGRSVFRKLRTTRRSLPHAARSRAAEARLRDAADPPSPANAADPRFPTAAPMASERSVGEDTTALFPALRRGGAVPGRGADDASDFDGYSIDGMSAIVGADAGHSACGGSNPGGSDRRDAATRRDAAPRDFDSVWGDDDRSRVTAEGSAIGDAERGAYGDLARNLDELVEREHEGSAGSASSSAEDPREADSGSEGDLGEIERGGAGDRGAFTLELLGEGPGGPQDGNHGSLSRSMSPSQEDEDSILGDMYHDETASELGMGGGGDDASGGGEAAPGDGDSVDSTPSWAAPIRSAVRGSAGVFRKTSPRGGDDKENGDAASNRPDDDDDDDDDDRDNASRSSSKGDPQEERTNQKFVSSLGGSDDGSASSGRSSGSASSRNGGRGKGGGAAGAKASPAPRGETAAESAGEKALGLTNSMDEEVDEDPAAMIDNINSMLSECREILDTETNAI